ncbi:penicillin-insensitive murein endopeptidase [Vibrio parahaemolyticus]|uniref:penicillin-insensitive murein endopeptidase n=1 Tax=Vibrio parahaemolyticus TaxID=670 RepID=UPI0004024BA8|nr:penicillin-insensitive murein endopeptidase [Vibrio parahaemolyticus]MBE3854264.1 hypothetical protein [Vibrio parahaemolyticus]MBE4800675.1 hypothetical protein [Vibrio parahaemolyticus]MCX8951415.1 penicillin-insensitive murein endopeptidase [Vibrio parahaemolyticus]OKY45479.1 hypothetical protein BT101_12705 [Vibrio parahaemolyticus]HCH0920160.1 penicillin-insensitive murein endopeptidase [Vibrio parahaemolyticus]
MNEKIRVEDSNLKPFTEGSITKTSFDISERDFIPTSEVIYLEPSEKLTWYINGNAGDSFSTRLSFKGGGHDHDIGTNNVLATGLVSPNKGTVGSNNKAVQVYTAPEVCGEITDTTIIGNTTKIITIIVSVPDLVPLKNSKGLVLVGKTSKHKSNHWGKVKLCKAISELGSSFYDEFKKHLYINDMSLQFGGLFDIKGNFKAPHKTHLNGEHVDINLTTMNEKEKKFFEIRAKELGFIVEVHRNPIHWHLKIT